jgi:nicotinate-nucleotide adenylyltransferase
VHIGLFFGSFNPIHVGHLIIADHMALTGIFDKVWLMVSPQNPLKPSKGLAPDFTRFDMARAAVFDNDRIEVKDIEFSLPKPSYTAVTLAHLVERYPEHTFSLIIGQDNLENFSRWKNYSFILENYNLYVYPRPGFGNSDAPTPFEGHKHVHLMPAPLLDISATYIRARIKAGKPIRYLVAPEVEAYIDSRKLYV